MKLSIALALLGFGSVAGQPNFGPQCYEPELTFLALAGLTAPWPPTCTGCREEGDELCNRNQCWCLPDPGETDEGFCCPDPEGRPMSYEFQVADAFRKNRLTLTEDIVVEPAGCIEFVEVVDVFPEKNWTECNPLPEWDNPEAVCGFIYKDNDEDCGGLVGRDYGLVTYPSWEAAEAAGAVITHYGACGVCSNAHDLGVYIDVQLSLLGMRGICAGENAVAAVEDLRNNPDQTIEGLDLYKCYKETLGLTDQCTHLHVVADLAGATNGCSEVCEQYLTLPDASRVAFAPETCEFTPCLVCELAVRSTTKPPGFANSTVLNEEGWLFDRWAGRTQERSGIVAYSNYYRSNFNTCTQAFDNKIITQDPFAKAPRSDPDLDLPVSESNDASGFDPSYSLLLQPDTCNYRLDFHFKMDETLPHAGGWDTSLPNGVDRETFEEHCSREEVIADDGIPYRRRRKFYFEFGEDVKRLTGFFDHISLDHNPCGHHDEQFFGRAHIDMHFYAINEEWRTIMKCDTTECDPGDCKYDEHFQSTESGKAFFEIEQCFQEPWFIDQVPPFILESTPGAFKGAFNKNMPLGFRSLSHTGNPHSGLHAINLGTAQSWLALETPFVEGWSEPQQFMMSFGNAITVWEPMVPVEFFQGDESRAFTSQESPPLCQTNMGIPLTYEAKYNADTGYTTFTILGVSPYCACEGAPGIEPGIEFTPVPGSCEANAAEQKHYVDTCKRFAGEDAEFCEPRPATTHESPFGKFSVAQVEEAFGLEAGSLITKDSPDFIKYQMNNFFVDHIGKPLVLTEFEEITSSPRSAGFLNAVGLGSPTFVYGDEEYYEIPLLGCFYEDKPEEIKQQLRDLGLDLCLNEPGSFSEVILPYHVVGYIDQYTRLMYWGADADFVDDIQFLTQLNIQKAIVGTELEEGAAFQYDVIGPSFGEYENFASPATVSAVDAFPFPLTNHGHFRVTVTEANLEDSLCPDKWCGNYAPGLPNPAAPNAPWPSKMLDNKCRFYYCAALEDSECESYDHPHPDWKYRCFLEFSEGIDGGNDGDGTSAAVSPGTVGALIFAIAALWSMILV